MVSARLSNERRGGGFNLPNYSVSPGNTIKQPRHDGKPSMTANQKQMPGNGVLSAVLRSQLSAQTLGGGEREREGERGSRRVGKSEID